MKTLENKIALVTGGSRGIGRAIVKHMACDGAHVAFTYTKASAEAEKLVAELTAKGAKVKAYQSDAAKPETMAKLMSDVIKDFGGLNILVNNAGVMEGDVIGKATFEQYRRVMSINVDSVFALTSAALPHLKEGARIINISSALGARASAPGLSIYNASKFAVCGLTRSWAWDLGSKGITVNAVLPGSVDTDLNPADGPNAPMRMKGIALGRFGTPEEVANVVVFLASDQSGNVNGACWAVDGGKNA